MQECRISLTCVSIFLGTRPRVGIRLKHSMFRLPCAICMYDVLRLMHACWRCTLRCLRHCSLRMSRWFLIVTIQRRIAIQVDTSQRKQKDVAPTHHGEHVFDLVQHPARPNGISPTGSPAFHRCPHSVVAGTHRLCHGYWSYTSTDQRRCRRSSQHPRL